MAMVVPPNHHPYNERWDVPRFFHLSKKKHPPASLGFLVPQAGLYMEIPSYRGPCGSVDTCSTTILECPSLHASPCHRCLGHVAFGSATDPVAICPARCLAAWLGNP